MIEFKSNDKNILSKLKYDKNKPNIICWYSCGVTSAVATKIALDKYKSTHNIFIIYFKIDSAHSDNNRFISECEKWYGQEIISIQSHKFFDQFDVIKKYKFINSPNGARCTKELKKDIRIQIEKNIPYQHQVFGFEFEVKQINRAIRFIEQYPNAKPIFPLIENNYDKKNCLNLLSKNNIGLPKMYELGFQNNNCIGCVKGGKGYWNKIRENFPESFEKMSNLEQEINRSCIKGTFLKDLKLGEGRYEKYDLPDCGVLCEVEFSDIISPKTLEVYNKLKTITDIVNK